MKAKVLKGSKKNVEKIVDILRTFVYTDTFMVKVSTSDPSEDDLVDVYCVVQYSEDDFLPIHFWAGIEKMFDTYHIVIF